MTRVLVTGASGYVGGRLCAHLEGLGHEVRRAGRTARPGSIATDFADALSLEAACAGMDAVVHLAAPNEPTGERDPLGCLRDTAVATLNLLDAAERAGVRRFVYASTAKVFGANPTGRIDEATAPRPLSHYAMTHRLAEDYLLARHAKGRIEGAVLRLSNAVGAPAAPGADAWMLIANDLCRSAVLDGRVVLKSSGLAWRNFIAMADAATAFTHCLTMPAAVLGDGLFHLGGARSIRILDLAERIAARAGLAGVDHADPAPGETHAVLDWHITKLITTGWRPADDLEAEIDATLAFCRAHEGTGL